MINPLMRGFKTEHYGQTLNWVLVKKSGTVVFHTLDYPRGFYSGAIFNL